MIKFDIVTIFPEIFDSYFKESIIARAQKQALIKVAIHNLRDFSKDKRKTVDDRPFGGGIGMVMGGEPIFRAARLIPGVIGKPQLLKERVTKEKGFIEYPQYTRPEVFTSANGKKWQVPKVLLSGNHKKIEEWRKKYGKVIEKSKNL